MGEPRGRRLAWLAFAAFVALLVLPNALNVRLDTPTGRIARLSDLLLGAAFWLGWFAVFPRLWWGMVAATVLALSWWPLELFLRSQVGAPVTPLFVGMAFETNPAELHDFFATHGAKVLPAYAALLGATALAVALARRHDLRWRHRSRHWVGAGVLAVGAWGAATAVMPGMMPGVSPQPAGPEGAAGVTMPMNQDSPQDRLWAGVYPVDGALAVSGYLADRAKLREQRRAIEGARFGATLDGTGDGAEVLVLVIGESSRADRWQLGGYGRATNPRLAKEPNGVFLRNVISRSVSTRSAVPALVSRRPVVDDAGRPNAQVEPSVLVALAEAGYATAWFSNQGATEVDAPVTFHARDAQDLRFLNPASYAERGSLDERLLAPLEAALARGGRQAIVLHTLGSHFNYAHRYPPAFEHFTPSLATPGRAFDRATSTAEEVSNAYDNSIVYTDHVLAEVIARLAAGGRRAALLFVSDHGEDLYEKGCFGIGLVRNSAASFRVPAYVWVSPALSAARPALLPALQRMASRPQASDFVVDTLLDLARVRLPSVPAGWRGVGLLDETRQPDRSVVNQAGRRVDFDQAERANRCHVGG